MEVDFRKKIEVEALSGVLETLDHYAVLKLKGGAPLQEVERAYGEQSKEFHPDRFFGVRDPKFMKQVTAIFRRINDAWQVLKDPELKRLYDEKMGFRTRKTAAQDTPRPAGGGAMSKAALEAEKAAAESDEVVKDKKARKYWDLALIAELNGDWNGVVMNLQFVLSFEKDNVIVQERLRRARHEMDEKKRKNANPYKIKIV